MILMVFFASSSYHIDSLINKIFLIMKKITTLLLLLALTISLPTLATTVKISTNKGDIYVKLYDQKTPKTVKNFLSYVNEGFYNGTIFHRVISSFMIQGGGFDKDFNRKTTKAPIANEAQADLKNLRGTIAMARLNEPHSATAQFFINVQDNPSLNHTGEQNSRTWGYAVFGEVSKGMDVVDEIRFADTAAKGPFRKDVPVETVIIKSISVVEPQAQSKQTDKK